MLGTFAKSLLHVHVPIYPLNDPANDRDPEFGDIWTIMVDMRAIDSFLVMMARLDFIDTVGSAEAKTRIEAI